MRWDRPPTLFVDKMEREVNRITRQFVLTAFNNVVALSPVDEGTYRNAHHISQGSPSYAMSGATGISIAVGDYRPIYIQNNLPYAGVIENGGYPNPVKYGTWRKDKKMYEVRSVGGYSYQAPTGVYQNAFNSALASLG